MATARGSTHSSPPTLSRWGGRSTLAAAVFARVGWAARTMQPTTQYARSGDVSIAYQVVGDGPVDLVFTFGWASHLDFQWTEPTLTRLLRRLAEFSRVIVFDKRGTGLSDPVSHTPTF